MDVNQLIYEHDKYIKTKARSLARDRSEADELCQKANIIIWQQSSRLSDMSPAQVKAFLGKSIRNALIDLRRQEKRSISFDAQPFMEMELSVPRFENALLDKMTVMSVIHKLSDIEQDIIFKTYFMGMDSKEISKQLNMPAATVRSKKARAHNKLKKLLKERVR